MKADFEWQRDLDAARAHAETVVIAAIRQCEYQRGVDRGRLDGCIETREKLERAEAENAELKRTHLHDLLAEQVISESLRAQVEQLREALEPFATAVGSDPPDGPWLNARAVLAATAPRKENANADQS